MRIDVADGAAVVLTLAGELDLATAELLREQVRPLLGHGADACHLVVDLSDLTFLDITGVGVLLEAHRRLAERGGSLVLRSPRPMVVRMLQLLDLERALQVEP